MRHGVVGPRVFGRCRKRLWSHSGSVGLQQRNDVIDEYGSRLKEDAIRPHCGYPVGEGTITLRDMATGRARIKPRWAHDAIGGGIHSLLWRLSVFSRHRERNHDSCKVKTCFEKELPTRPYANQVEDSPSGLRIIPPADWESSTTSPGVSHHPIFMVPLRASWKRYY